MTKKQLIKQVELVINMLKAEIKKDDSSSNVYKVFLERYKETLKKLKSDEDFVGGDISGCTQEYVDSLIEQEANKDLVEALWKAESILLVLRR